MLLLGDMVFQVPLGWLSGRCERTALHLGCGMLALLLSLGLALLIATPALLWPALVLLGAVAGGFYTLAMVLIGQRFRGRDLVTANASAGLLWGIGSLLGSLLSGALMDLGPHGLPLALSGVAGLFVATALVELKRKKIPRQMIDRLWRHSSINCWPMSRIIG